MIDLYNSGVYLLNGTDIVSDNENAITIINQKTGKTISKDEAKKVVRAGLKKYKYCTENNIFLEAKFDYQNLKFENSLIYCDIPYKNSKKQYYDEIFN